MGESLPPPGWYEDPRDPTRIRYWDGWAWAEESHPADSALEGQGEPLLDLTYVYVEPEVPEDDSSQVELPRREPMPPPNSTRGVVIATLCLVLAILVIWAGSLAVGNLSRPAATYCTAVKSFTRVSATYLNPNHKEPASHLIDAYLSTYRAAAADATSATEEAPDRTSREEWTTVVNDVTVLTSQLQAYADAAENETQSQVNAAATQAQGDISAYANTVAPTLSAIRANPKYACKSE